MFKKIILNSGVQIFGRGISLIFSLILTGVLTRKLGITGYGNYILIITLINLLITTSNWGTQIIGVRELSRTKDQGKFLGNLGILRFLLSLITIVFGSLIIIFLPVYQEIRLVSLIVLPIVMIVNFGELFNVVFQTKIRMDLKTLFDVTDDVILLGATLFFIHRGFGLVAPLIGILISKAITIGFAYPVSKKFVNPKISLDWQILKKIFFAALPLGIQLSFFTAYDKAIDSFIIQTYLGASQVGIYGLAYKVYSNLILPAYYLNSTILPILSGQEKESKQSFKTALGLTLLGIIIIVPLTIGLSDFIIQIISGAEFLASSQILKILAFSLIFSYFNHLNGFFLIARNRQIESLVISLIGLFWNICLNLIFIPQFGILAAAWITVSTEALVSIVSTWRVLRCYNRQK